MAGRGTAEGPSLVKVKRKSCTDIGECFESDIDQFGDAAGPQEVDGVKEGYDDEIGKVKAT